MTESPETRLSLIVRLKDRRDQDAWFEFLEIYRPLVFRLAVSKGLQHADAEDVTQQVFAAVARAVDRWRPDANRARFRTWLTTIARNAIFTALSRRPLDRASGDTTERELLAEYVADSAESQMLVFEARREVFQWAARRVRVDGGQKVGHFGGQLRAIKTVAGRGVRGTEARRKVGFAFLLPRRQRAMLAR